MSVCKIAITTEGVALQAPRTRLPVQPAWLCLEKPSESILPLENVTRVVVQKQNMQHTTADMQQLLKADILCMSSTLPVRQQKSVSAQLFLRVPHFSFPSHHRKSRE